MSKCSECRASPCDCNEKIWSYAWRTKAQAGVPAGEAQFCQLHSGEVFSRARAHYWREMLDIGNEAGPVQRVTEPMYQFEEPKAVAVAKVKVGHFPVTFPSSAVTCTFDLALLASELFHDRMDQDPECARFIATRAERPEAIPHVRLRAWELDQNGWRTAAEAQAMRIFERLGK